MDIDLSMLNIIHISAVDIDCDRLSNNMTDQILMSVIGVQEREKNTVIKGIISQVVVNHFDND